MLHSIKNLRGYSIQAEDGMIGEVHDLFFDDHTWAIRYLVVDTGKWLPGRLVLISPVALGNVDKELRHVSVKLTKEQVQNSPDIDTDKPVSRQREIDLFSHYGWPPYWPDTVTGVVPPVPMAAVIEPADEEERKREREKSDPHLRSMGEVLGYGIHCTDGEMGHLEDFLIDGEDWIVQYLAVDTRNWLPGKKVLLAPGSIQRVSWTDRAIYTDQSQEEVRHSPEYHHEDLENPDFEAQMMDYSSRTKR